jgi:hypothetical protein
MRSIKALPSVARCLVGAASLLAAMVLPQSARADEGGISAWLPGTYGSLAAVPGTPGFAIATIYYHSSVRGGGNAAFFRGGRLVVGLDAGADLFLISPSYTFANPVAGGRLSVSLTQAFGRPRASISGTLTGPLGNTISGTRTDTLVSYSDLFPSATLKWNFGAHNVMTYLWGVIPVGDYDPSRLANTGIGHGAIDGGAGYTYFDPTKGHELSVVAGLTYNFINPDTQYQNGVNVHVEWGASQFLSKQLHVGLVGYLYNQLGCDSGAGATLGCFRSRVAGIGPQVGYIIPMGEWQGYLNLKGYHEFAHQNRPEGWNVWVTFALSRAAEPPPPQRAPVIRKF